MSELKPCPFCGRIPTVDDCGDNRFFVRCKCGIAQDKLYGQRCDAVKRWNTRRQQPEILRCKYCKHSFLHDNGERISRVCGRTRMCGTTPDDWFCADAERGEE